ncbi:IS5 family transposase [Corallococcus interemptor]|uniref:IS5 family transposase n=1 Tax=Corallococcus interemptor TaxID=2316720 RepID=A0A3A8Q901_9BACT|nr:IS5 family transposase [Corallococcus interemptor]RKH65147.1 IS5 family transposase [Corallococcus interemptor]
MPWPISHPRRSCSQKPSACRCEEIPCAHFSPGAAFTDGARLLLHPGSARTPAFTPAADCGSCRARPGLESLAAPPPSRGHAVSLPSPRGATQTTAVGLRAGEKRGARVGKCRAGNATKLMALADGDGLPLAVYIAEGNRFNSVLTEGTLDAAFVERLPPRLIADKAWDGRTLQRRLQEERGIDLIAPKRKNSRRKQDGRKLRRYKRRWKVERLFAWLKRWRRIATRWERKAENFLGFIHLGCVVLLLRRLYPKVRL